MSSPHGFSGDPAYGFPITLKGYFAEAFGNDNAKDFYKEGFPIVRLLIVDDEKHICEEFRETLENEGYEVDWALTGKEGLRKVSENPYDLVFLDESMPQMKGEKVLEKIRQTSKVPVAFISGFMTPAKERKVMAMGALTCLHKPLDLDHLKVLIRSVEKRNPIF